MKLNSAEFNLQLLICSGCLALIPWRTHPGGVIFFLRLFRAVPRSGRFQITNLLGYSKVLRFGLGLGFGLGL